MSKLIKKVALIGFMGAGKSTVGRLVARRLGFRLVDTDRLIERRLRLSIPAIFARQGEKRFRRLEDQLVARLIYQSRLVVATGGGIPVHSPTWPRLAEESLTVFLDPPFEWLWQHISHDPHRPLATGRSREELRRLWQSRREVYREADLILDPSLITPRQAATIIVRVFYEDRAL